MARYSLFIKPSAVKEIESLPTKRERQRIVRRIQQLAEDPYPPGCKKLSGRARYRIRQGEYRMIYSIEKDELVVFVIKIGRRKQVYRSVR